MPTNIRKITGNRHFDLICSAKIKAVHIKSPAEIRIMQWKDVSTTHGMLYWIDIRRLTNEMKNTSYTKINWNTLPYIVYMRFESRVHLNTMLVSLRKNEICIKIWITIQIKNTDILTFFFAKLNSISDQTVYLDPKGHLLIIHHFLIAKLFIFKITN